MSALRQLSVAQSSWQLLPLLHVITAFAHALVPEQPITHGQSAGQSIAAPEQALSPWQVIVQIPSVQSVHAPGHAPMPGSSSPHLPIPVSLLSLPLLSLLLPVAMDVLSSVELVPLVEVSESLALVGSPSEVPVDALVNGLVVASLPSLCAPEVAEIPVVGCVVVSVSVVPSDVELSEKGLGPSSRGSSHAAADTHGSVQTTIMATRLTRGSR
jgi:hypothetical protein